MQTHRPPHIRMPCFLLISALMTPLFFFPLTAAAAAAYLGRELPSGGHGDGLITIFGIFLSMLVSFIFAAYALISTWPKAESDLRLENRIDFLGTRKGVLATCIFLAAQLLIVGSVVAAAVRIG